MTDEMLDLMDALRDFVERERTAPSGDFRNPLEDERVREQFAKAFAVAVRAEVRGMFTNA